MLILMIVFILLATPAWGFTSNNNMQVSVVVPSSVQLLVGKLDFGASTNPLAALTATAAIQVNMASGQTYKIAIDAGLHFSSQRRISDAGGHFRAYTLYQNAARTLPWGDADQAASYLPASSLATIGSGTWQSFMVYGSSAPAFSANAYPPGSYTDTVTITLHY